MTQVKFDALKNAAECGDAICMAKLGEVFYLGQGVSKDESKAFVGKWKRR
ncbi:MAG: hypothetical protein J6X95_04820 [Treponema sp.]|nr:hypothetical protein [Treponema sp.]